MEGDEGAMEDDDVSSPRVNVRVGDWKFGAGLLPSMLNAVPMAVTALTFVLQMA